MEKGYKVVVKGEGLHITELLCECGEIREVLLHRRDDEVEEEDRVCPKCGSTNFERRIAGAHPTTCHDPDVRSEKLRKRSLDHSAKHMKKNWDRLVDSGKLPK